jgi:serine/threonine protein kinase
MTLNQIGRFKVGKKLGAGAQGTVYLCFDTQLQRRVAIKLLDRSVKESAQRGEARAMSRLQHPNIVSIYEAGEQRGLPFMVFEYVEGELLSDQIRSARLELPLTLNIFRGILQGMAEAHRAGIVHRDLKPGNIIINPDGVAKIMDFGIARLLSEGRERDRSRIGTPRYLAPEYISRGEVGAPGDVFALGLILDEMLTGMPVFSGSSQQIVLDSILKARVQPPSCFNEAVDERLDRFILKALEKDPDARYADAGDMLKAFEALKGEPVEEVDGAHGTVEFLLRRMRRKSDFPVLSQSVRRINAMSQVSGKDAGQMASVIVKDFALTNKILKVVNSAYYGRFSGKIGTVSRAVVVLGIQAIRSLAASLIFFEHLGDKQQAERLREQVSAAMFSAVFASQLARQQGENDTEGFFLAAMLRDLGRILVAFYLPDESREVERLQQLESLQPIQAQHQVLGVSFETVGIEIARQWNFPDLLTDAMKHWKEDRPPTSETERRRMLAAFAGDATRLMAEQGIGDSQAVSRLLERYRKGLGFDRKTFLHLSRNAMDEFKAYAKVLNSDISQGFVSKIVSGSGKPPATEPVGDAQPGGGATLPDGLTETRILNGSNEQEGVEQAVTAESLITPQESETLLMDGLQEVTSLMVADCEISELFNVVLETMYRSMGFRRVVLALYNRQSGEVMGRSGFGDDLEPFIKAFRFPMKYSVDVFHGALKNAVDVYIANTAEQKMQQDIPQWYKQISNAGSFLLFPLVLNGRPLGLIYADHPQPDALEIDKKKLNLLKALRNQILLALRSQ